jgi:hypothetical protein
VAQGAGGHALVGIGRSARYRFALQVDEESLRSIVHDEPPPEEIDSTKKGWVRLIDKSWYPGRSLGTYGPLEPVEGETEEDVGWMRVRYQQIMTEWYVNCRSPNHWGINYKRPPQVA